MPKDLAFIGGKTVAIEDAKVGIMTHALHYGTAIFEGIRANWNEDKSKLFIFRPWEHYERFLHGCSILKIEIPYDVEALCRITVDLVEACGYSQDLYIRPLAFKSAQKVANLKLHELDSEFALMTVPFGNYLDLQGGARCCTSSWRRMEDTMIPPRVKIAGLYVNSILAKTEAVMAGFDEAIMLNHDGNVSEGTGENIFMVVKGQIVTPPSSDNILMGITRNTIAQLVQQEMGLEVVERTIKRSELYLADEVFLTGTAAHLTPVGHIDNRPIADGAIGPISSKLLDLYSDVIRGKNPKYEHWCLTASPK